MNNEKKTPKQIVLEMFPDAKAESTITSGTSTTVWRIVTQGLEQKVLSDWLNIPNAAWKNAAAKLKLLDLSSLPEDGEDEKSDSASFVESEMEPGIIEAAETVLPLDIKSRRTIYGGTPKRSASAYTPPKGIKDKRRKKRKEARKARKAHG